VDYEITRKIFAIVQARPRALAGQRGSRNQMKPKRRRKETAKSNPGDQIKELELI
tara:strand:- start:298 stop:462 length:165 start_codon:yes stop_codon:yes gene_type:complete